MPDAQRRPASGMDPTFAFINIPFDSRFEPLYLALIAGLCGFGLVPQAVLQIPGSQRRLNRLLGLIRSCRYSFHDLSRVELDPHKPRVPRFNMPFELGLVVSWAQHARSHRWYVLEAKSYRAQKSLSDINGTEIYVHDARPIGILRALTNALERTKHRPTVRELRAVYRDVKATANALKQSGEASTLFDTRPFRDLVLAASLSAQNRIVSLQGK